MTGYFLSFIRGKTGNKVELMKVELMKASDDELRQFD